MMLLYVSLQSVGFLLALFFASIGYGFGEFVDLSDYYYIYKIIIVVCLLAPFVICLVLFRLDFLKGIFKKLDK